MDACNLIVKREVFPDMNSAHLPANHTFARVPKVDPTSRVVAASGARIADAQEFCMCGDMGARETSRGPPEPRGGIPEMEIGTKESGQIGLQREHEGAHWGNWTEQTYTGDQNDS